MKTQYLVRLDDACPYMDSQKWQRMEDILDQCGVKPLVGIIPANADPQTMIEPEDTGFWKKAHRWEGKGWEIALHGFDHVCVSNEGLKGLNPVWARSEFVGLSLEEQRKKIREGMEILRSHGIVPKYFFTPSHTFDINTMEALRQETDIHIISDTYSLKPYKKYGFAYIPCQLGHPEEMRLPGLYTICLHPNNMDEVQMTRLEQFLKAHQKDVLSFSDIDIEHLGGMRCIDKMVQWGYFMRRKIL